MAKASGKNSKSTAKKTTSSAKKTPSTKSAVRNTAVPRKTAASAAAIKREPSYDEIARRAYEIYASGTGGSEQENWHRAERELRGA